MKYDVARSILAGLTRVENRLLMARRNKLCVAYSLMVMHCFVDRRIDLTSNEKRICIAAAQYVQDRRARRAEKPEEARANDENGRCKHPAGRLLYG
jgi:hypothetical protein